MTLDAYFATLPGRTVGRSTDPPDPGEYTVPCGVYVAPSRGAAKRMLLADHGRAVYPDEFADVRTRLLERGVTDVAAGPLPAMPDADWDGRGDPPDAWHRLWLRAHEVEHHAGGKCDCGQAEAAA